MEGVMEGPRWKMERVGLGQEDRLGRGGGRLWEEQHPGSSSLQAINYKCYLARGARGKKRL